MDTSLIERWQGHRVLVLGDVMLDRFVYGRVERISPEAPIPVLHFESEMTMLGGAGNVARNIVALGGRATLVGVLGQDTLGDHIAEKLSERDGIDGRFVRFDRCPTTVKTRYVSGGQQIMRLDTEERLHLDSAEVAQLVNCACAALPGAGAVVLSDYAKGVLAPEVIRPVIDEARKLGIPVIVDPKTRDVHRYSGATVITPNESEAAVIANQECKTDAQAEDVAKFIQRIAEIDAVVLTRGKRGMTIYDPTHATTGPVSISSAAQEVFDVSGAGDTVVATLSLALAGGIGIELGARVANIAAGIAVGKRGTATVDTRELSGALHSGSKGLDPKIVSNADAAQVAAEWRAQGLRVGFTNGVYDLLHPGHVELLKQARKTCDRLVVGLNSDASVKRLKGPTRPIQNEQARSIVMASIRSVDLVTLFEEDTPLQLIQQLIPDILVKGADYSVSTVVGAEFVQSHGGKVVLVPLEVGHSTTSMIDRSKVGTAG